MALNKVLVIEDDPDIRETIKEILELEGFAVSTAANGREALDQLASGYQSCLILLDLMMPVMDGWQFLATLKAEYQEVLRKIPIVVVSAAADIAVVQQQYDCRIMQKPCNVEALLALAHEYCEAC